MFRTLNPNPYISCDNIFENHKITPLELCGRLSWLFRTLQSLEYDFGAQPSSNDDDSGNPSLELRFRFLDTPADRG